ncbi:hypothetical protein PABY_08090 [Pyrodictium abyssi]|uniref:Uncharacterized protein n=2 Tax=Pyrodictium abyssi TaxID=54256 RepID=A0ABN6ZLW9_9CREN|nr:hypothetical protein PABY_08090 [Pyrodictium abyssi]
MVYISGASLLRIFRKSKEVTLEDFRGWVDEKYAALLMLATSCEKGQRILETELLPEGVVGSLAALDMIDWEAKIRPPKPSPYARHLLAYAAAACAAEKGIPMTIDELEKMAEESEVGEVAL